MKYLEDKIANVITNLQDKMNELNELFDKIEEENYPIDPVDPFAIMQEYIRGAYAGLRWAINAVEEATRK